jgi:hypothetical protein
VKRATQWSLQSCPIEITLQNETTQTGLPICVPDLCPRGNFVSSNCDGLSTGCDTVRPHSERESTLLGQFDTIETRCVSDRKANCDTDRSFSPRMTLPCVGHYHLSPLIQNTPFDFLSSNPKALVHVIKMVNYRSVELVKQQ